MHCESFFSSFGVRSDDECVLAAVRHLPAEDVRFMPRPEI